MQKNLEENPKCEYEGGGIYGGGLSWEILLKESQQICSMIFEGKTTTSFL